MVKVPIDGSPYFSTEEAEIEKGYTRPLFKPGVAIQARELNVMTGMIQEQFDRFGKHILSNGAMVIPGGVSVITAQDSMTFTFGASSTFADIDNRDELYVRSKQTGLAAAVLKAMDVDGTDPATLFVEYINSGTSGDSKKFIANEDLIFYIINEDGSFTDIADGFCSNIFIGQWAKVAAGIYFIDGVFVANEAQNFVISKYTDDASLRVGFKKSESVIDADEDNTLFSNAQGYINYQKYGADRLKIDLEMTGIAADSELGPDEGFFELIRVRDGVIESIVDRTDYSIIEDTLAQRTYEESGDYTVKSFDALMREHLKTDDNDGVYLPEDGGDESKAVAAIKPGIAYVKGYRVANNATEYVTVDKARDTDNENNTVAAATYGNYIIVGSLHSLPVIDITKQFDLFDAEIINAVESGNKIGTCRCRSLVKYDASSVQMFIFDIQMIAGKSFSDVKGIRYTDVDHLFGGVVTGSTLYESSKNTMIFELPNESIQSLKSGGIDTSYTVVRDFMLTADSSGVVATTVASNELFATVNNFEYLCALDGSANPGTLIDLAGKITLTGTPVGRSISINLGISYANATVKLTAPILKQTSGEKTKTLRTHVMYVNDLVLATKIDLEHADIYKLESVIATNEGNVITDAFTLDNGQRDSFYQKGSIHVTPGQALNGNFQITYQYFEHSRGDYFSVDSYSGVSYENIPEYINSAGTSYKLADCIDFRVLKDVAGGITPITYSGDMIRPNDTIRADATFYLPRIDVLWVNRDRQFGVSRGTPSLKPAIADVPSDAMAIYELYIPPYTGSADDIQIQYIENKRYTMKDIGKLENRIENIEYYTALNNLESSTLNAPVVDPQTGNERFKNGIATDNFVDFSLSDAFHPEYAASIDPDNKILSPEFVENALDMELDSTSGTKQFGTITYLDYTVVDSVSQPYATRAVNVNPYAVFAWVGSLALNPSTDFWKDTQYAAPRIINRTINNRGAAKSGTVVTGHKRGNWKYYTSVTTAFRETSESTTSERTIRTTTIPYMRRTQIHFSGKALKPYARVWPFFEDIDVSEYCRPDNGDWGDSLITNRNGEINGYFWVPNDNKHRFLTGTNTLRLSDSEKNSYQQNEFSTEAYASHNSAGTLVTKQQTITTVKTLYAEQTERKEWRKYVDPVAQTFVVSSNGGEYITGVEVFLKSKSQSIPLRLQIRTAETGLPTNVVIPLADKVMNPEDIHTSANASVGTYFEFDSPVYLSPDVEYAVVLLSDSQEYEIYVAQMGEIDLTTNYVVSKQPHMGVFFTSQNGSTWSEHQNQDLKFTVKRCHFGSQGSATYSSKIPEARLCQDFNPIKTTKDSQFIQCTLKSHGLKIDDSIIFEGVIGGNGYPSDFLNKTWKVLSITDIDTFIIDTGQQATATGSIGGGEVLIHGNMVAVSVFNRINELVLKDTIIDWAWRRFDQTTRSFTPWRAFIPWSTIDLESEAVAFAKGHVQFKATMSTVRDNISPVIDTDSMICIGTTFRVNSDVDNHKCAYVTKDIVFDTPSTSSKIWVDSKLPGDVDQKLFVKIITDAGANVGEIPWTEVSPVSPIINDGSKFLEYEYNINDVGTFVGLKCKVVLLTDVPTYIPHLLDFRMVTLA